MSYGIELEYIALDVLKWHCHNLNIELTIKCGVQEHMRPKEFF